MNQFVSNTPGASAQQNVMKPQVQQPAAGIQPTGMPPRQPGIVSSKPPAPPGYQTSGYMKPTPAPTPTPVGGISPFGVPGMPVGPGSPGIPAHNTGISPFGPAGPGNPMPEGQAKMQPNGVGSTGMYMGPPQKYHPPMGVPQAPVSPYTRPPAPAVAPRPLPQQVRPPVQTRQNGIRPTGVLPTTPPLPGKGQTPGNPIPGGETGIRPTGIPKIPNKVVGKPAPQPSGPIRPTGIRANTGPGSGGAPAAPSKKPVAPAPKKATPKKPTGQTGIKATGIPKIPNKVVGKTPVQPKGPIRANTGPGSGGAPKAPAKKTAAPVPKKTVAKKPTGQTGIKATGIPKIPNKVVGKAAPQSKGPIRANTGPGSGGAPKVPAKRAVAPAPKASLRSDRQARNAAIKKARGNPYKRTINRGGSR